MARLTKPLTDTEIKKAQPKEGKKEYSLADGKGLYLRVKASGSKSWVFNYYRPFTNRRANIGLGTYPEITLKRARELRAEYRELLANDIDPKKQREKLERQHADEQTNTFLLIAEQWINTRKSNDNETQDVITDKYAAEIWRLLENYVFPIIGKKPITMIERFDLTQMLKPFTWLKTS